jgi:polar amino acid transport system substrate-binding protein
MFIFQGKTWGAAFFGIFLFTAVAMADPLPIATGEWVPFSSKTMKDYGAFTRRVTIVFQEMGIEPAYRFYPWQRCFDAVLKAQAWAAFPYAPTAERAKKFWFSDTLACSKTLFFYYDHGNSTRSYRVESLNDLKSYKLGGIRGYFYEKFFEKSGINVDYVNKEISAMEKLKLGRIDLVPVNELVGWNLVDTHFPSERHKFKTLALPLSVNTLCLMVSRDFPGSKAFLERFNRALSICVRKGRLTIDPCKSDFRLMK